MARKKLVVAVGADTSELEKGLGSSERKVSKWGEKLAGWGKKAAIVGGVAIGAGLAAGALQGLSKADMVTTFENSLGVSPEYAAKLGDAAGAAYAGGFGGSLEEAGAAASAVNESFGDWIADTDLQPLTEQALALAQTFQVDMAEATMAAGTLLKNGLVGDGQEAMDVLTKGLQGVPQAVREEILAATNEYSKHFAGLGLSGSEALRMFRSADGVIGVDKMGDSLKELTIRATDMSTASVDAMKLAGLNADEMAAKIAAGGPAAREGFDQIIAGLSGIEDPVAQANAAIALFGTPLEDLGVDQIPRFLKSLGNVEGGLGDVEGAADKVAKKMTSGPRAAFEKFKRKALDKVAETVATKVLPALEDIGAWAKENPGAVKAIAAVIGVVLVGAFVAWAASAAAAAAATLAATWPIIAIAAAVAALVAGFVWAYQNVDWFRDSVDRVASFLTGTLWPALQSVAGFITGTVVPVVASVATKFGEVAAMVGQKVGEIVSFVTGIPGRISATVSGLWSGLMNGITVARDWVKARIDEVVSAVSGISGRISGIGSAISGPFLAAFQSVKRWWNSTVGGFGFDVPSWVPGVGGKSFRIPEMHTGGVVPGGASTEVLRLLQGGEVVLDRDTVSMLARSASSSPPMAGGGGGGDTITVNHFEVIVEGSVLTDRKLVDQIRAGLLRLQRHSAGPILPGVSG